MMDRLRRNVIIPYVDRRRGNDAALYQDEVDRELSAPLDEIRETQRRKLREIVLYAHSQVPFYRRRGNDAADRAEASDWEGLAEALPVLEKDDIRAAGRELLSGEYQIESLFHSATGGTTSSPVEFYLCRRSLARRQAATRFFQRWYGHEVGDSIALLWGALQDFPEKRSLKSRLMNHLTHRKLMLPSAFLDDAVMERYWRQLRDFRPTLLQAYPYPLYIFAQFLQSRGLQLEIPSITLTAEPLFPEHRAVIEECFGQKVFNWYGARELGHAASECEYHQGLHLNCSGLYFEVRHPDGTITDEGEGELITSDLNNRCMPLLRYRIGDMGVLSKRRCECGSELPLLESITGRVTDVFRKRDGTQIAGVSMTGRVVTDSRSVKALQIVQEDYERFTLRLVPGPEYGPDALAEIQHRIEGYLQEELEFTVEEVESIPREKSGKLRFCVSRVGLTESPEN